MLKVYSEGKWNEILYKNVLLKSGTNLSDSLADINIRKKWGIKATRSCKQKLQVHLKWRHQALATQTEGHKDWGEHAFSWNR